MADDWQSLADLAATPADNDEFLTKDTSDTTDDAVGTVKRNSYLNVLGTVLAALRSAFTPASAAGPASLAFAEDTDNGSNTVSIAAPAAVASNKTATLQDVTGTIIVTGGTDLPVADGGTGVSTLGSGNVLVGAGTSPITSAKAAPAGDFVGTTDTQTLSGKTINNVVFTGTVTVPDAALAIADTSGLQSALDLKAPLASPTFTTALTAANPTFTGTVTIPDGALAIADTSGLQSALDLKAPLASPTFTGTVALPNDQISYAEMQNVAALSVVGNATNATADPAEITAGSDGQVLRRSGTTLGFGTIATAGIADAQVTYAKIQNVAGLSVVARSANTSGVGADVTAGSDGDVLRRSGTTLGFGAIPQGSVTSLTADLALKAPLASPTFTTALTAANPTFTGTVTIPDGALAIADTSGLQTALDAKAPLASPTFTGTVTVPAGSISYGEIQNVSATDRLLGARYRGCRRYRGADGYRWVGVHGRPRDPAFCAHG